MTPPNDAETVSDLVKRLLLGTDRPNSFGVESMPVPYSLLREAASALAAAEAKVSALVAENRELRTTDDPTFTYAFKVRAEAAEAKITDLAEALERMRVRLESEDFDKDDIEGIYEAVCAALVSIGRGE